MSEKKIDVSKMNTIVYMAGFRFQLSKAFEGTFDKDEIDFIVDAVKQRINRNIKG